MGSRLAGAPVDVQCHFNMTPVIRFLVIVREAFEVAQFLRSARSTVRKPAKFAFLFFGIPRREIGYNFLETWVAAQRIPVRVQFQVTVA
jgi:hypothetical protein